MSNNSKVDVLFERARSALNKDPTHHLPLGWRQAIWSEIGPRGSAKGWLINGHLKRAELASTSAYRALPVWRAHFDTDELPMRALEASSAMIRHEIQAQSAESIYDELWRALFRLSAETNTTAVAAGFAAVQALGTTIYDELFDPKNADLERLDDDDPETIDAAYYASIAISGGLPNDHHSNRVHRRSFWTWWLSQARMVIAPPS
jgi:hypothetical protein